jgi:integrase
MVRTPNYLQRNSYGIYYFRIGVPRSLQTHLGQKEIRRSLRTGERSRAIHLARILLGRAELLFELARGSMSKNKKKDNSFIGYMEFDSLELGDMKLKGVKIDGGSPEEDRKHLEALMAIKSKAQWADGDNEAKPIPLSKMIEEYCAEKKREGSWTPKTEAENRAIYNLLIRIIDDVPIDTIGHEQAREYKKTLQLLPPNINKKAQYRPMSIAEIIKTNPGGMSISTINKNLNRASSLFGWGKKHGYVPENYFEGLGLKKDKQAHDERAIFEQADLDKLFSTKVYTEGKYLHPYYYWLPLIGLYTGARIEEICQLHLEDIRNENEVWVFDINNKSNKKIKTSAAQRLIPIHPAIIDKGLTKYVAQLRKKGHDRLFPELKKQRDGYSQTASKWFSRYKEKCGIFDKSKVFHSFRHTVANHLKQKGVDGKLIMAILGHKDESMTTGRYGKPYEPNVLMQVIEQLDFSLPPLDSF